MDDQELTTVPPSVASDGVIVAMAYAAGVPADCSVGAVDEIAFESLSECNDFALEVWTRFHYSDEEGQQGVAHHPGRLDELIPRTVRSHSRIEIHDDLSTA